MSSSVIGPSILTEVNFSLRCSRQFRAELHRIAKSRQTTATNLLRQVALDDNGDTTVSDYIFDQYKKDETSAQTDGFDMDVLWDISPITNFTTQYSDPYYA